ncbi:MAG: GNAT family N-acetyltransferase [Armatimonadota bacterium]
MSQEIFVRPAALEDLPDIAHIYNQAILNSTATFDTEPRSIDEWQTVYAKHSESYPLLVAEVDGRVVGWGALRPILDRPAARFSVENAVYVDERFQRRGVGSAILAELVRRARSNGYHAIIAMVVAGNEPSEKLHRSLGFEQVGLMREVGWKFGRWLDLIVFEKLL